VVDDAHAHVLVAGSTANAVDVFDFSGHLLQVVNGESGADGLAISGSIAYVSNRTSGVIDQIDLNTLASMGPIATGLESPWSEAVSGGMLWVSTSAGLAGVDPTTGTVSLFPYPTFGPPLLATSPGAPNQLFAVDAEVTPPTVYRLDLSSGQPVVEAQNHDLSLGQVYDMAVSADGTRLLVTGSFVTEFNAVTLATDGVNYGPPEFSFALATSPGQGGIMAEGLSTTVHGLFPDLVVQPLGQDSTLFSTEVTDSNSDWIAPGTLKLSADGQYVFAVNPVPYDGSPQTFYAIHFGASSPDTDLSISVPKDITRPARAPTGAVVTYPPATVTDPDDPSVPAAACSPDSGSNFSIGTTTVTCTVTDPDDTPSTVTASFTVTVEGAAAQLSRLADTVLGVGPGGSLEDKVRNAQSELASGNMISACSVLTDFVNEVKAQTAKSIPATDSSRLIASAERIRAVIAC
jgi:hypothetical protein